MWLENRENVSRYGGRDTSSPTGIASPWETIKMVPTTQVAGHKTSLDSQSNREHAIFSHIELLPEEVQTPFVLKGEKPVPPPPPPPGAPAASAPVS